MVRFTLRQCAYFRAVAEHGGIAQAARALSISQPSVAQALAKLEAVTGLVLFERRHARGVTLTLQGRLFLDHVVRLEKEAEKAAREARKLAAGNAGEIRLGMFHTLSPFFGPPLIRSFAQRAPEVRVLPRERALTELAEELRSGALDLALTYDRGADTRGLELLVLAALQPMALVPADHRLAGRQSVSVRDLADEPYVMFEGPGSRAFFEELLSEIGIDPPVNYVSSSLEAVRSAVGNGFGFTLLFMLPRTEASYDGKKLKMLGIREKMPAIRIVLASRRDERKDPLLEKFARTALRHFASPPTVP